jgi:RNA polymerase sigma-70 factor
LTDNRIRPANLSPQSEFLVNLQTGTADVDAVYCHCAEAYPTLDLPQDDFKQALIGAVNKYLVGFARDGEIPTSKEIHEFVSELHHRDLYLTLACARGNEQAWWEFDRRYRPFIERLARKLVGNGMDANEVIDSVYVELYGTKTVEGVRQSKFRTYTGRGTLRGWLRTVILHAAADLHRGRQDEIPLEEWSKTGEEIPEGQNWRTEAHGSETAMLENVTRERYRSLAIAALDQSLAILDAHETLLLLYYHVEGLKLREIARIVEAPSSSIRPWFQRRSKRQHNTQTRIHESTVMRWLDKVYKKVSNHFQSELKNKHGLNTAQIEVCLEIATEDFGQGIGLNLEEIQNRMFTKDEAENCQVEGASQS